jgi:hypothetical protein
MDRCSSDVTRRGFLGTLLTFPLFRWFAPAPNPMTVPEGCYSYYVTYWKAGETISVPRMATFDSPIIARRMYASSNADGPYRLVGEIPVNATHYLDDNGTA